MGRRACIGIVLVAACQPASSVYIDADWPRDHTAVVLLTDETNTPLEAPHLVTPRETLEVSFDDADRVRVHVRTYEPGTRAANGDPIHGCSVEVGGAGDPLPPAHTAWISRPIDRDDDGVLELQMEPVEAAADLDLRSLSCTTPDRGCVDFSITKIDLPSELRPFQVAPIGNEVAIIGADVHVGPTRETMFARISGDEVEIFDPDPALTGFVNDLAWNGADELWGVDDADTLFRMSVDGQALPFNETVYAKGVAASLDGTVLAYGDRGTVELLAGGTVVVQRTDVPADLVALEISRAGLMLGASELSLYLYDGVVWDTPFRVSPLEELKAVAIDDRIRVTVGSGENARLWTTVTQDWTALSRPYDAGVKLRAVASLGGGRFVTVGDESSVAVYNGRRWCPLDAAVAGDFLEVEASPSGRVAWAVQTAGRERHLYRIDAASVPR